MRKLILFVLVFGLGLGVLLYVVRWRELQRQESVPTVPIDPGSEGQAPDEMISIPGEEDGQEIDQGFVAFDGRIKITIFNEDGSEALPTYQAIAEEVDHIQANEHVLHDIRIDFYDPESGAVRAKLKAKRGRAHLKLIAAEPKFQQDQATRLWDVEFTLLSGAPFVPLTVYVPELDVDLDTKTFTSDSPVRLVGSGMEASSRGLYLQEDVGLLRLEHEGSIELWIEDQTRIQLDATGDGPIELSRSEDEAGELLQVAGSGGSRLVIEGRESLRSDSDALVIRGRRETGGERDRFVPVDAEATSEVVLRRGSDRFEGDHARFDFAADGQPRGATLSGEPHAWIWVDAALDDGQAEGRVQIEMFGEGPLVAGFQPNSGFELSGPGRVLVPARGLTIDASETIAGEIERDGNRGNIRLRGEVIATSDEATFRGPALDLMFRRDDRGESVLEGRSPGPSHIEWLDLSGRRFLIDTEGEADWVVVGEELLVPLARKARVILEGEGGFEASAGLLQNFRRSTQSFDGSEGVVYETKEGTVHAQTILARGPKSATFIGSESEPVRFDLGAAVGGGLENAHLEALRVEREPEVVTATGAVFLQFESQDGEQELECSWLELRSPALTGEAPKDVAHPFTVRARGVQRASFIGDFGAGTVGAREILVHGTILPEPASGAQPEGEGGAGGPQEVGAQPAQDSAPGTGRARIDSVEAHGAVEVEFSGDTVVTGKGDRFEWNPDGGGRLIAGRGRRASAVMQLAGGELPYRISAAWIEFGEDYINAQWPRISLDAVIPEPRSPEDDLMIGASAEWMSANEEGILFSGLAHLVGRLSSGEDWRLDANSVHVSLARDESGAPGPAGALESMIAWNGFEVQVGRDLLAQGDVLEADFRVLRMEGAPARMEFLDFVLESTHIEYDVEKTLVKTEQGRATGADDSQYAGWTLDYESLEPFEALDSTILVVRNPTVRDDQGQELRAAWALFWVDRDRWRLRTRELVGPIDEDPELRSERLEEPRAIVEEPADSESTVQTIFGKLRTGAVAQVLTETYLEGDVEFLRDGERYARMDAAYLDLIDGHGWLENAEVYWDLEVSGRRSRLVARAQWMRHSADGSLHADRATVTSCDFAEPHLFVQTRDLRFTPIEDRPGVFQVNIRKNSLRFDNGFGIPLPALSYKSDSKGRPYFGNFSFGDSARFGSFVSGTFNAGLGIAGSAVASMVGKESADVDGSVRYRASWLGSRGVLLGTGLEASVKDKFWMNLYVDAINDDGEDRGMVRVPIDERPGLRYYLRGRARYILTDKEWFDFAFNTQSDAGVQSEFYEGQFLFYEERDNYVHWRKAENEDYRAVTTAGRLNDFRNYLARLPEAIVYGGLKPISEVAGRPLLYTSSSTAGVLRRLSGTEPASPFDPLFEGGEDLTVMRVDSSHRLEVPFTMREGSWTLSPFTTFRGSFWSQDAAQEGSSVRGDIYAGAVASTHFERVTGSGVSSAFTPTVGVRTDIVNADSGGNPIELTNVELEEREGFLIDLGLRTQLWMAGKNQRLTFDLRGTHGSGLAETEDGWLPIAVLAQLDVHLGDMPVFFVHDGRYDPDDRKTVFSRSILGFIPTPDLGFEFGLSTGRNNDLERVYDAGTVGASWRATEKWEVRVLQTVSFEDGTDLASRFILRRFGHDFVFDLVLAQRAAEGSSLGFSIRPLLGFRSRSMGHIGRWLDYDG